MVADELDYVVGVDTHRDEHVLAVVVAPVGAVVARRAVAANAGGYAQALRFADSYASGRRVWAVEGAGHYGAPLLAFWVAAARRCSRLAAAPEGSGGCRAKTTGSTRSAPHVRRLGINLLRRERG